MSTLIKAIQKLCEEKNISFVKKTDYHYQVIDRYIVNVYPTKSSYYVNGASKKSFFYSPDEIIRIAKGSYSKPVSLGKEKRVSGGKAQLRKELFNSGHTKCWVCGEDLTPETSTLEHRIPLSKGGSNRKDNLTLSHEECNKLKGNKL